MWLASGPNWFRRQHGDFQHFRRFMNREANERDPDAADTLRSVGETHRGSGIEVIFVETDLQPLLMWLAEEEATAEMMLDAIAVQRVKRLDAANSDD